MIKIQKNNFSLDKEIDLIKSKNKEIGAVSTFVGYVRNINQNKKVNSIYLEVYENMAFKSLEKICNEMSAVQSNFMNFSINAIEFHDIFHECNRTS